MARAAATAFLTHAGPRGARLVIPAAAYDAVFPVVSVTPRPPNITRTVDVAAALAELEVERVRRTRLLDQHDEIDLRTYCNAHPEDPPPVVLLVTNDLAGHEAVYPALLDGSARLGIASLHIGDVCTPRQVTVELDEAGTVLHADGTSRDADLIGAEAYVITPPDAAEALTALAAAVTDDPEPQPEPAGTPLPVPPAADGPAPRISIRLLGTYQISVDGEPVRSGLLRASRELLAYYAVHLDGATAGTAVEMLWPDTPAKSASDRFWNAVGKLHSGLRVRAVWTNTP